MTAPTCSCCGRPRTERKDSPGNYAGVNGWCSTCTRRWYRRGRPDGGPPPPMPASARITWAQEANREAQQCWLPDYIRLRRSGVTRKVAAARVGVSERWARRVYGRLLAARASTEGEAA